MLLYVKRWLAAPLALPDGTLQQRDRGTPQGSAISPVLANLFMHYAFDAWMARDYPGVRFERYADDAVVHCVSDARPKTLLAAIGDRMDEVGLRLHPDQDEDRVLQGRQAAGSIMSTPSFTFLGFTFQARAARARDGTVFTSFLPAISKDALNRISGERPPWRLHHWTGHTIAEVAARINPIVRGWMQYYGAFYRSALCPAPAAHQRLPDALAPQGSIDGCGPLRRPWRAGSASPASIREVFAHWAWVTTSW